MNGDVKETPSAGRPAGEIAPRRSVSPFEPAIRPFRERNPLAISLLLVTLVGVAYVPVLHNNFVNFDDPGYVYDNIYVQRGLTWEGVRWAFKSFYGGFWHPLTWLSILLDAQLYGPRPGLHHLTSVLLHAASMVVLFLALRRMTGATWRSAVVAGFFGVHPLHVESVAWASERKDVLSALFFLLSLLAYTRYAEARDLTEGRQDHEGKENGSHKKAQNGTKNQPEGKKEIPLTPIPLPPPPSDFGATSKGDGKEQPTLVAPRSTPHAPALPRSHALTLSRSTIFYALALVLFACGLMSKTMVVTLPVVLLLIDFWPLKRWGFGTGPTNWKRRIQEKVPFFALAVAAGVITIIAQNQSRAVQAVERFPVWARVANAIQSVWIYISQTFWPANLIPFYPYPKSFHVWIIVILAVLGVLITGVVVLWWRRRPYIVFGWVWYLVTVAPVIGLLQVGSQAHADRYSYIPLIGIFIIVSWGLAELAGYSRESGRGRLVPASTGEEQKIRGRDVPAPVLTAATIVVGLVCVGLTQHQVGYWRDSMTLFEHAVAVTPNNEIAHNNLGTTLFRHGRIDEAMLQFNEAVRLAPRYALARGNLGSALIVKRRYDEAIVQLQEAVRLDPTFAGAYRNLGAALGTKGRINEAVVMLQQAVKLAPNDPEAYFNLGVGLAAQGKREAAIAAYQQALRLRPGYRDAQINLQAAISAKPK